MADVACCWIDASAGAAGDMLLAALLDAGAPLSAVAAAIDAVGAAAGDEIAVETAAVRRHGLRALRALVRTAEPAKHRTLAEVLRIVGAAHLPAPVSALAEEVFTRLGRAEAAVHGEADPLAATLHEVGALDALADVVGCAAALHALGLLEPRARFVSGGVALGSGTAESRHGSIPVPAPAVLEILRATRAPVRGGDPARELCTPTGAALLAAIVDEWGAMPPMRVTAVGVGAGSADPSERANVLRVVVGSSVGRTERGAAEPPRTEALVQIEATVDDLDPRLWPSVLDGLVAAGAADAWLTPAVMRKGRPGYVVSAIAPSAATDAVAHELFAASTTLGLRVWPVERRALPRDEVAVRVDGCEIRVKRGFLDGEPVTLQPEYADVAEAARRLGRPARSVMDAAAAAARSGGAAGDATNGRAGDPDPAGRRPAEEPEAAGGPGRAAAEGGSSR